MDITTEIGSHIHQIDRAVNDLQRGSPVRPEELARASTTAIREISQALTKLATEVHRLATIVEHEDG